jgi:hypothetical protein
MKRSAVIAVLGASLVVVGVRAYRGHMGSVDEASREGAQRILYTPPRPLPQIAIRPGDMSTKVAASSLTVSVHSRGAPIGEAAAKAIAAQISLVTWPERQAVPFTTTFHDAVGGRKDGTRVSDSAVLQVVPSTSLEARWYFLAVKGAPTGFELVESGAYVREGAGIGARFTTASAPAIRSIRHCMRPDDTSGKIVVDFTEEIRTDDLGADGLLVMLPGASSGACKMTQPNSASGRVKAVTFACSTLGRDPVLNLSSRRQLRASSGLPLNGGAANIQVLATDWRDAGDCRIKTM